MEKSDSNTFTSALKSLRLFLWAKRNHWADGVCMEPALGKRTKANEQRRRQRNVLVENGEEKRVEKYS